MDTERETVKEISDGIDYIREHKEINNVLLTGGDPLLSKPAGCESILHPLREIEHVNIIRIGSKMLAYNPFRILNDPDLCSVLSRYSTPEKRIYLMAHFNHPRELTDLSIQAAHELQKAGVMVVSQTPILNGINSEPETFHRALQETFICRDLTLLRLPVPPLSGQSLLPGSRGTVV